MQELTTGLHCQYQPTAEVMVYKVDKQSNSNLNFPKDKIHTLEYDLCDMEIPGYKHN